MAIEKNIVIGADLSGLETKLGELIDLLKASQEQANKTSDQLDEINQKVDGIGKNSKNSSKNVKTLADRFKGMGVAIKAAGIGLLLQAMGMLKELFDNNQKTVDFFNTTFNSLQIAFSDFASWVESNIGTFTGFFKDIFENPKERLLELGKALKDGVIARFEQLLEVFGYVGRALLAVVKGDFTGAMNAIKEAGKQSADVLTGVDGSFEAVKENIKKTAKAVADYTKETIKQGRAMTETNKQAEIAEVRAQGLIEKYDLQAEKLRQVRDDERLSMDERIKANEELGEVLKEQEEVMLENAQRVVDAKARQLALDKDNIEFQKEYMAATNELAGVQAQVAGFRSEQLMNEMALQRELLDIERARADTETEIFEMQSEARRDAMFQEKERIAQELTDIAVVAFRKNAALDEELENTEKNTARYYEIMDEKKIIDQEYLNNAEELKRRERDLQRETQEANLQIASDALGVLMSFNEIYDEEDEAAAKKAFERNKKLQIGQAIINTAQGIMAQLAVPQDALTGQNFAKAAVVAATGIAQVAKIRSTQFEFAGDSGVETGGLSAPSTAPQFNVVGGSGTNALIESLQANPMRAYVVGSDVTSQQQLDRNRINQVSFP